MAKGFALIELLIVIAIMVILAFLVAPSLGALWRHNQLESMTQQLLAAIHFSQTSAMNEQENITLCGATSKNCDGQWSRGQVIVKSDGTLLRHYQNLPTGYELTWNGSFNQDESLTFVPTGFTDGQQGHFTLCDDEAHCTKVVISMTGRVKIE